MLGPIVVLALLAQGQFVGPPTPAQLPPPPAAEKPAVEGPWPPEGVSRPGNGVTTPKLIRDAKPNYTPGAMRAKISGGIFLEAVVQTDGTVGEVRVIRSLDREYGLDDQAVATVKKWQFEAGKRDGIAVPVLVEIEMWFTLKGD